MFFCSFLRNLIKSSVHWFTSDPGRVNREGKQPPEISDFSQKLQPRNVFVRMLL